MKAALLRAPDPASAGRSASWGDTVMWIGAAPERPLGTSAWVEPCAGTESAPATSYPIGPGGNAPGGGRHLSRCRHRHVRWRRCLRTIRRGARGRGWLPGPGGVTRGRLPGEVHLPGTSAGRRRGHRLALCPTRWMPPAGRPGGRIPRAAGRQAHTCRAPVVRPAGSKPPVERGR